MTPKVYVIKEQIARDVIGRVPMDYSPALQYGELEFITNHDMPMYPKSSVQAAWNADVNKFIMTYNPESDFIITTGQPHAMFCVGWALGLRGKAPRFLVWRREENRYRILDFDGRPFV